MALGVARQPSSSRSSHRRAASLGEDRPMGRACSTKRTPLAGGLNGMALMGGSQSTPSNVADQASRRTASTITIWPEGTKSTWHRHAWGSGLRSGWSGCAMATRPRRRLAPARARSPRSTPATPAGRLDTLSTELLAVVEQTTQPTRHRSGSGHRQHHGPLQHLST
jgi:hypothetical protein